MRKGNEVDFDPEKMMAGEWAISLDKGIVRMCIQAGVCIRMATYEAFEEDMVVIENILKECQTIEEAVIRIREEINKYIDKKIDVVVEYVGQAKTYRDEAEQFRNEAKAFRDNAEQIAGIGIATTEKVGIVRPDGTTIRVDVDGTIHADNGTVDYTELINKPKINGVELNGDITSEDLNIKSTDSVELTQAQYDALPDTKYTDGINYYITDAGADSITASNVGFNDSVTQLGATTTQKAIEKVNEKVGIVSESLGDLFGVKIGHTEWVITEPNSWCEITIPISAYHSFHLVTVECQQVARYYSRVRSLTGYLEVHVYNAESTKIAVRAMYMIK